MFTKLKKIFWKKRRNYASIDPDEILIDSQNLPEFNTDQFEGRIEKPISSRIFGLVAFFIFIVSSIFLWRLWNLQITDGEFYAQKSQNNSLHDTVIFADRGLILDRDGKPLAWNELNPDDSNYSLRRYATSSGLSTTLGYIKYPTKDKNGFYYQEKFDPKDGLEKIYDTVLSGRNGEKIVETDVSGKITAESVIDPPQNGKDLSLTVDIDLQKRLYQSLLDISKRAGYKGGGGVIMDVRTGEIIALANFPEYDSQIMTDGDDSAKINSWISSRDNPFLNRVIAGLYTPGSIVKPFVAMGVLDQKVIGQYATILSTGSISVPNPYNPSKPSIFYDWKAHGYVDLRRAIAVSSDVYFYEVGGGYGSQKGIGIYNIEKYVRMFGLGSTTGIAFPGEKNGTIPDPEWKAKVFNGEDWRVGDTYNTSIGQYGFQITPLQVVRSVAALANGGLIMVPNLIKGTLPQKSGTIKLDDSYYKIVKEGMRLCVTDGTCSALSEPFVSVAAKTGTAQIGILKDEVNSWIVGFWPYEDPHYAFAVVMERGSKNNQFGSVLVMKEFFDWVGIYATEYLK
jgi:penicillin-binding protein 2